MDEKDLITLLQDNDPRGYEILIESYADMIYRTAYRILQNQQDAEDALQETYLNIYRHIGQFNGKSKLSTWIYRIASNTALDIVRKRQRKQGKDTALDDFDSEDAYEPIDQSAPMPEESILQRESVESVRQALAQMPAKLREAYLLYMVDGYAMSEIAQMLDISPSAAKVRVHRARQFLKDYFTDYAQEE